VLFLKRKQETKQQRITNVVDGAISAYRETGENTDVLGMYTGISWLSDTAAAESAVDGGKTFCKVDDPVQDADDL